MRKTLTNEKGITLISLTITIIVLGIIAFSIIINTKRSTSIQNISSLKSDINNLSQKVSDFYTEYGKLPAEKEYLNTNYFRAALNQEELSSESKFYVIDLQAMKGVSLNYGRDYEKAKDLDSPAINQYTDLYVINSKTHNIFYVEGISIEENNMTNTYHTSYLDPENTPAVANKRENAPEIVTGMTQIMFIEPTETNKGITVKKGDADFNEGDWYNYADKRWANAMTQDGSMWVWIPRYAYRINSSTQTVDVKFLVGTTDNYYDDDGSIKQAKRQKTKDEVIDTTTGYTVHPAFTDESKIDFANGGWDKELTGIWVAKFEAGKESGSDIPVFKPLTYSYHSINIGQMFTKAFELKNTIISNSSTIDSHLMKSTEWGATAYLSQSKYGLNGTNIAINNINLNNKDGGGHWAVTGVSDGSENGTEITIETQEIASQFIKNMTNLTGNNTYSPVTGRNVYAWNQKTGTKASTTGTIYGIYDMSGGVWENTASYLNNNQGGFEAINDKKYTKYVTTYTALVEDTQQSVYEKITTYGDAIKETSVSVTGNTSWYGDHSYSFYSYSTSKYLGFGGYWKNNKDAGVFAFESHNGYEYNSDGFRTVLIAI